MALRILAQNEPFRSIYIVAKSHVLLFSADQEALVSPVPSRRPTPRVEARFEALDDLDITKSKALCTSAYGTLGMINIGSDIFICVITAASSAAVARPGEHVQRILAVEFCEILQWQGPSTGGKTI